MKKGIFGGIERGKNGIRCGAGKERGGGRINE